jgi:phage/plasmid-associated DNA primase
VDDKVIHVGKEWLQWSERRTYDDIIFDPSLPPGTNRQGEVNILNTWQGFSVEPKEGNLDRILEFVSTCVCLDDEETYEYLLNLMALIVQKPDQPLRVALVFIGQQGTGKSTLMNMIGSLFGDAYKRFSHQDDFSNHFNAWQENTCVVGVDESFFTGDKRAEGFIKSMITDTNQMVTSKGVDSRKMKNMAKLIFATNHADAVPADLDDRRFSIFKFSDLRKNDTTYFAALEEDYNNNGKAALLHFLLNRDITEFVPVERPESCMKLLWDQKTHHLKPYEAWWYEKLCSGVVFESRHRAPDFVGDIDMTNPQGSSNWPKHFNLTELYEDYNDYNRDHGTPYSKFKTSQQFWKTLKEKLLPSREDNYSRYRPRVRDNSQNQTERGSLYPLCSLEECRDHFVTISSTPYDMLFE